jgi:hypothetical protein
LIGRNPEQPDRQIPADHDENQEQKRANPRRIQRFRYASGLAEFGQFSLPGRCRFWRQINPLDKYCPVAFRAGIRASRPPSTRRPANAGTPYAAAYRFRISGDTFFNNQRPGLWVPACAGTTHVCFNQTVCGTNERSLAGLFLPKVLPVSAASTSATMWSSRSSRASFFRRSRPKITLSVALLDR